jgi:S-adenosylmethionine synthetase
MLTMKLSEVRKDGTIPYLGPDGKSQVTVNISMANRWTSQPSSSHQHDEGVSHDRIEKDIIEKVIKPVCGSWLHPDCKFYVNPTGIFVFGGPYADAGLTVRKNHRRHLRRMGRHGGGAFSGKDHSKVDRSGA